MARKSSLLPEGLPPFVYDTSLDAKTRARLIEQEMNEQAKIVQDLKQLGATNATIDIEARKLAELEAAVFNDFRQVPHLMMNRFLKWWCCIHWLHKGINSSALLYVCMY